MRWVEEVDIGSVGIVEEETDISTGQIDVGADFGQSSRLGE